ncbi:MAG: HAD hydrolase-like protein [Candidatus Uhrbacteria bacterium]|nr:HAD hydrolase-like protein [Candidatus Uhrbacteria bacterium]
MERSTIRGFMDLDGTLLDWKRLFVFVYSDMLSRGHSCTRIDETLEELNRTGYSFATHLSLLGESESSIQVLVDRYRRNMFRAYDCLLPGVPEMIVKIASMAELTLITFGDASYQRMKWDGLVKLHRYFRQTIFVGSDTKAAVISTYPVNSRTFLVDDSSRELCAMLELAPWVRRVRMMHPDMQVQPHEFDGVEWDVVKSAAELLEWVRHFVHSEGADNGHQKV